jgi:hypothetical protein
MRTVTVDRTRSVTRSLSAVCQTAWSVKARSGSTETEYAPEASVVALATTTSASSRICTVSPPADGVTPPERVTAVP